MEEGRPASQSFSMHEHADPAQLWNRLGEYRDTSNIATPVGDPSAATFSSNNEPDKTGDHQRAAQTTQRRAAPTQQVRTTACTPTAATPAADLGDEGRHNGGATDPNNVGFNAIDANNAAVSGDITARAAGQDTAAVERDAGDTAIGRDAAGAIGAAIDERPKDGCATTAKRAGSDGQFAYVYDDCSIPADADHGRLLGSEPGGRVGKAVLADSGDERSSTRRQPQRQKEAEHGASSGTTAPSEPAAIDERLSPW